MPPSAPPETSADTALSPAMRQYRAAKEAHPDALLFFRMGDFYELFYEDAVTAARELQLTLTARDKLKAVPMCGVPYHAAGNYLQRLLRRGFRVALCEQMEDPKLAKGVVRREVTRVLTPGTALDPGLGAGDSQWLAALATHGTAAAAAVGIALLDLSTGEFLATDFTGPQAWALALDELARLRPAELLFAANSAAFTAPGKATQPKLRPAEQASTDDDDANPLEGVRARTAVDDWVFTADYALPLLRTQLRVHSLDGMGLAGHDAASIAAGAIVHYLRHTRQGDLEHLDTIRFYERRECLELDAVTVRNLELVDPLFTAEGPQTTLLHTIDHCCTPMGKRLLRAQLLRPMHALPQITARLDAVAAAAADIRRREALRRAFDGILDLERLLSRVALDSAGPRDIAALGASIARLPQLREAAHDLAENAVKPAIVPPSTDPAPFVPAPLAHRRLAPDPTSSRWSALCSSFDVLEDLTDLIRRTLNDEPPVSISDGGAIRARIDAELDELRELSTNGRQRIAAIEERERARTGINSLKVRFNSVFGYYIEVTRANSANVPADYERKQTLVNAERFTTPELKDLEVKILTAQERSLDIERRLFADLRREILAAAHRIRETARCVAELDLLASFAHLAAWRGWTRPQVDDSGILEIRNGRHPVVERRLEETGAGRFIPNSLHLEAHTSLAAGGPSLLLITGPNMGGKSTFLRQAALLTILAQCGSFVPADAMRLGIVDRVYTRIGASDNVARGRSTFMVEMTETAAILNTATARSLVLLDEMGRGTATYDGLSLAWAAVEHLHDATGARTLFATHYHELTLLADRLARLQNARVTVRENPQGIVFLHTVEPGPANKSYGIEVARLAGLPSAVIARAREVLKLHERAEKEQVREAALASIPPAHREPQMQMTMFTPLSQRIVDRIESTDIDGLTPRDALALLAELQRELKGGA